MPDTLNLIGLFNSVVFITITSIVAVPFVCYKHPNELTSLRKYPEVLCSLWTSDSDLPKGDAGIAVADHGWMVMLALILAFGTASFYCLVLWMSWVAPRMLTQGNKDFLCATRF